MSFTGWIMRLRSKAERRRRKCVQEWHRALREQLDFQPTLARLEDRRVLSVSVGVDAGVVTFQGGESSDSLALSVDSGGYLQYSSDGGSTWTKDLDSGDPVVELRVQDIVKTEFYGGDGDDTLTVDFGQGNPTPTGGLFFAGDGQKDALIPTGGAGRDLLELVNVGPAFPTHTYNYTSASAGSIALDDGATAFTITYTGLEPLSNDGTPFDVIFNLPGTADASTTLSDLGSGQLRLAGASFEDTDFAAPAAGGSITINLGDDDQTLTVDSLSVNGNTSLTIDGDGGSDTIRLNTAAGLAVTGDLSLTAETITQTGTLSVSGATKLTTGPTGTASLINTSNDFQGPVSASGGDVDITDANGLQLDLVKAATLDVVATGPVTQTAAGMTVTGAARVEANGNPISLTAPNNDFQGPISLAGTDVDITDANGLQLDLVKAAKLDVVARDDITVNAAVAVGDTAALRAGSDGSGSVNVTSTGTLIAANPGSDISLQAGTVSGSIALAGSVTAVDRLTLSSVGGVSQAAAAIRAANLQLTGAGAFSLNQSGNDVDTVAADLNGGSLALTDANSIAIGSVATAGIATGDPSAGGAVTINATSGTITVAQAIDTSEGSGGGIAIRGSVIVDAPVNSGGGAITLNADTVGDSVLEINAGVTSSGGDVKIVNRKAIQIRAPVNNAGSGNITIASFGGGDLTVAGPVTSGSEAVGGAGNITLQTGGDADGDGTEDGDILIESDMTTYGGLRKEEEEADEGKADEGKIYVDAAGTISVDSGVTIRTGTGQMQGASSADGLAQTPPPISVRLVPVDQGGSNVDSQGHAIVEITVHDPAVLNYQVTIDWADGYDIWGGDDVVIYPLAPSVGEADDFAGFQSGVTYRFDYSYQGKGNPNLLNPSAPIPIKVTIAYDGRADLNGEPLNGIVFREGGKTLESLPVTDVLTVPGTGLFATIKVVKSEIVPVALRQATGTVPIVAQVAAGSQQTSSYEPPATQLEFVTRTGMQLFFRHVDATGQEGEDVDLPPELLERGLFDVFQRFPNGRYRIYLKEANSDHERLIQEVNVYQGRIVPPDFRENASERQMDEETPKPTEQRPADEPKAEEEGRDAEKADAAKAPVPKGENGPAGDESAQAAAATGVVGGTAMTLGWAVGGGVQRWAEQVDRAFQAGRRSLSRTARLARRLQSG